jgi:hypothetical protein
MTETTKIRRSVWLRVYGVSNWILMGLFALLATTHVVMTVLFYVGVVDQGFGSMFDFKWPAWLITLLEGSVAVMLWFAYRRGVEAPWLGLGLTVTASVIVWGRASWMVFVPVLMVITIAGSVVRIMTARRTTPRHT